jgi:3-hydroxyacyl-[acyl-carrier-protein] dehydratase
MKKIIDITQILKMIPHRYPFVLVDRVTEYEPMDYIKAIKHVTMNEPYFTGHFPDNPIMPGVLMLEALAQTSAILAHLSRAPREGYRFFYFFAGIKNAKFKQVVIPGDTLDMRVKFASQKRDFWSMRTEAYVEDKLVCSAELLSAIKEVPHDN